MPIQATEVDGLNGGVSMNDSDVESDAFSDTADGELSADKLDPADRELYEKLKQQEREEREEIERELKAHEEALARHQEELRLREKELHLAQERMQQRAKLDGGGDGGGGVSGGGSGVGGSGVGSTGSVGSANGGDCGGSAGGITTTTPNNNNNNSSAGRGQGPGSAGSGSSNSSNNSNTFGSNGSSSSSHGLGKHTAPQDLRAHVHAAQLAALSHAAGLGHLGQFSPRDLKLDIHPLRAAGVLPTHGPFSQSGGTPPERYPRPLAQTPQPPSSLQSSPEPGSEGRSHHWTFEEQFKQVQVQTVSLCFLCSGCRQQPSFIHPFGHSFCLSGSLPWSLVGCLLGCLSIISLLFSSFMCICLHFLLFVVVVRVDEIVVHGVYTPTIPAALLVIIAFHFSIK